MWPRLVAPTDPQEKSCISTADACIRPPATPTSLSLSSGLPEDGGGEISLRRFCFLKQGVLQKMSASVF
ncbi:unnamed protein product [Urochloa humidicola]